MEFHLSFAYGIAIAIGTVLSSMAVYNRRTGWHRERSNGVLDTLMAWAQAREEMHVNRRTRPVRDVSLGGQLAGLSAALIVHAGVAPAPVSTLVPTAVHEHRPDRS